MSSSKIDLIKELYPDETFVIADGFDDAIIGVDEQNGRIVYDIDEVIEFYEYNIAGAYYGEKTPVFIRKIIEL